MLFKVSNLNSNLALTLGYLNPAFNNSAQKKLATKKRSPFTRAATPSIHDNNFNTNRPKLHERLIANVHYQLLHIKVPDVSGRDLFYR